MARGQNSMAPENILYGRTSPLEPPVFASYASEVGLRLAEELREKFLEVRLPEMINQVSVQALDLHQLACKFNRDDLYPQGPPQEFKEVPALWVRIANDLEAMRKKWPDMTEGPTDHYADDTEFFATMTASALGKSMRPRLMIIGFGDEEDEVAPVPPARAKGEYLINFAFVESSREKDALDGIRRVW